MDAPDRALVDAVLANRAGAFEQLVRDYQGLCWHVIQRMVRHPEDTRELCQEAFLRVHRYLHQYRFDSPLKSWIGQVAYSVARRHLERKRIPVAEDADGQQIGCGALHVMWDDLGEIRTLIVADEWLHHGVGRAIVDRLEDNARSLGLRRLFCLTFEVEFFSARGFEVIGEQVVDPDVYSQLIRSPDEGVAEFLDLAHVKPNTLGNTRMLKTFE